MPTRTDAGAAGGALRIVHVYDGDYPTPDVRTEKVSRALTDAGHEVHIVARNRAWQATREERSEGVVHRMHPWRWIGQRVDAALGFPAFASPRWISLLASTISAVRPHVILARDLPLCPAAIWVGRWFGVPVVFDMAENYPAMMRDIWDVGRQGPFDWLLRNPTAVAAVERYCIGSVDHIIVVIEESATRLIQLGANEEDISIVRNTPLLSRVPPLVDRAGRAADAPLELVYLGLIELPRGIAELLEAVALLRNEGGPRPVRCTLIGSGRDELLLRARAHELGLGEAARFLGFIPYQDALPILARADVGVVPHRASEAWNTTIPNKLFDYMAAGLPVITSDAVPAARIVRESSAGEVFQSANSRDLAAAIMRLFDNEVRLARGQVGRRAVVERYNWANDAAELVRTVEFVAHRGAKTTRADSQTQEQQDVPTKIWRATSRSP